MDKKREPEKKRPKKRGRRILKWLLAALAILVLLVVLLVPVLVSSESCRRMILAKINKSVDGRTDFSDLSMGWFKGVRVEDLSFEDDSGQLSIRVRQIETKPHYGALLTGNLSLGKTVVDRPQVRINLREPPPTRDTVPPAAKSATKASAPILLPVRRIDLEVRDGNLRITDPKAETTELAQINSKVSVRPAGMRNDFALSMLVASGGEPSQVNAAGSITPGGTGKGWTLNGTTGNLTVDVNDMDLKSLESFFALAGVEIEAAGVVSAELKSQIADGTVENLTGTVNGTNIELAGAPIKGDRIRTAALDVGIEVTRQKDLMNIDSLKLKTDWADLAADGTLPTTLKSLDDFLKPGSGSSLKGSFNVDVAALSAQMPKTLGLKEGTKITSGRLTGDIRTGGQDDRRQIIAHASLDGLNGTVDGKPAALSKAVTADVLVSSDKTAMTFDRLEVLAPFARINCTGTAERIKYDAEIDLASLQSELGQFVDIGPYRIAGAFVETGQVSIGQDAVTVMGSGAVTKLSIAGPNDVTASMPEAKMTYTLGIDKKTNTLNIESVNAETSLGRLTVEKGVVPLGKESAKPMNLLINAGAVDLAKVRPFAVLLASLPKNADLAGILESSLVVTSEKGVYRVKTDSTKISNFKFVSPPKRPFEDKQVLLTADLEIDPAEKNISLRKMTLVGSKISAEFAGVGMSTKANETTLAGRAKLQYDWEAVSTVAAAFLPEGLNVRGKRTTALDFSSRYPADQKDMLLANLNTNKFRLGFDSAAYMGLDVGPTDVNIAVEQGVLKIDPFKTTVNEGQLDFAASADFKSTPRLLSIPKPISIKGVRINEAMSEALLTYINPIFAGAANVTGVAGFSADRLAIPLAGAGKKDVAIAGMVAIDSLSLRPAGLLGELISLTGEDPTARLKIHPTSFTVEDGFVRYDDMQLDIGSTPVHFKGAIGLDESLDMTVTVPLGSKGLKIGDTTLLKNVSARLTGTVRDYKLDVKIDQKEITDRVLEGVFDSLFK